MIDWVVAGRDLLIALLLVVLNGFFVAAEFALVKVRGSQLDLLVKERRPFAATARWLSRRMDASLSACQLGITIASLGLGWVGEPAFAELIRPLLASLGVESPQAIHTTAFVFAFSAITALHLVIGEQAPKIFALRRPELLVLWCALPLVVFYFLAYPFLVALHRATSLLLRMAGVESGHHDTPHSEEEIRALVAHAHVHGELTPSEQRLIDAVFEFDDLICRRVMVPRSEVVYLDVGQSLADWITVAKETHHTRFPVCDGSLDETVGMLHIKDLVGVPPDARIDLKQLVRPAHHVPENMLVSRLLRHFQSTHQLMALVDDEHGTVVGIVTLENVLEQIVGAVEDEFDREEPFVSPGPDGQFVVLGSTPLNVVRDECGVDWDAEDVDTVSGFLTAETGRTLRVGDRIELNGTTAEVLQVAGTRATRIRITQAAPQDT